MPAIVCHVSADTGSQQYILDLSTNWWRLQQEDVDTDLILMSGENMVRVHQAVLLPLSTFIQELIPVSCSSCSCSTPAITLPSIQPNTLSALVEIIYTGRSNVASQSVKEELNDFIANLQLIVKVNQEEIKLLVSKDQIDSLDTQIEMFSSPEKSTSSMIIGCEQEESNITMVHELPTPTRKFNQPREANSAALAKITRGNKEEIQSINENDILPKSKKKKLDMGLQQSEKANKFINIQDIIADNVDASTEGNGNDINDLLPEVYKVQDIIQESDQYVFSETLFASIKEQSFALDSDVESEMTLKYSAGERQTKKENIRKAKQSSIKKEKLDTFSCPFCAKEFTRKFYYNSHLSCAHFKEEIIGQFPGLVCQICNKSSIKKSEHVKHLGAGHKIIDSLMPLAFAEKMAQINEQKRDQQKFDFEKYCQEKNKELAMPERVSSIVPVLTPQVKKEK